MPYYEFYARPALILCVEPSHEMMPASHKRFVTWRAYANRSDAKPETHYIFDSRNDHNMDGIL